MTVVKNDSCRFIVDFNYAMESFSIMLIWVSDGWSNRCNRNIDVKKI